MKPLMLAELLISHNELIIHWIMNLTYMWINDCWDVTSIMKPLNQLSK